MIDINNMNTTNSDAAELNKFGELAHKWWDKSSEFKPLHDINPLRLNYINDAIPLKGKAVLDVGCGGGILSESMAEKGAIVTGIDLGEKALNVAQLHSLESGVEVDYRLISAEAHADDAAGQYDVVTCLEMLEHVPDPASIVRACAKLVKPGGHVFFSTINRNLKAYAFAVLGAEYILNMLPKGTHDYAKFIKPSELASFARQAELSLIGQVGMSYNPITQHYWLNDDVSVNYLVHMQKASF
jgi:2-polyprenyl-6-hydroxyphenyl methylase / 3-demethylubiquinone-9 3-methyltransferase